MDWCPIRKIRSANTPRWQDRSEMEAGDLRSRTQPMMQPNFDEIDSDGVGFLDAIFRAWLLVFGSFSGIVDNWDMTCVSRASNCYLARSMRWLDRELDPGQFRGSGRVKQVNFSLSLSLLLPLSLSPLLNF